MIKHRTFLAVVVGMLLLLTGCAAPPTVDQVLQKYGMGGMNAVEIIEHLEAMPLADRPEELLVSVKADELLIQEQPDGVVHTLPMPKDQFYVSIAPYTQQTHECFHHSLTTCLGELPNTEFFVDIKDRTTQQAYVKAQHSTHPNGFMGFWLPRDRDLELSLFTHADDGWEVKKVPLSTKADAPTCVTEVRLGQVHYVDAD